MLLANIVKYVFISTGSLSLIPPIGKKGYSKISNSDRWASFIPSVSLNLTSHIWSPWLDACIVFLTKETCFSKVFGSRGGCVERGQATFTFPFWLKTYILKWQSVSLSACVLLCDCRIVRHELKLWSHSIVCPHSSLPPWQLSVPVNSVIHYLT